MLGGELFHVVEIDALVFPANLISDHVVRFAGEIQFVAVRKVAAMGKIEAHNGVARLDDCGIRGLIRLRAGMRLHVDVLRAEEFFRAGAGDIFHFVGVFAAAVIALAGVTFRVFVGKYAAGRFQNGFGREVLAGDQFQLTVLAFGLLPDEPIDIGIGLGKWSRHGFVHKGET